MRIKRITVVNFEEEDEEEEDFKAFV